MITRIPKVGVFCIVGILGSLPAAGFPELPAFQDPPTNDRHPGQLIWADLFTEDVSACTRFYTGLFDWTAETLGTRKDAYTLFRNNGRPVAGVIYRPAGKGETTKGIWIPFFSVNGLDDTLGKLPGLDGQVEVPARDFPKRGSQAIIRDNQGALLGLMQTSQGDPDDFLGDYGDLIWAQLWVRDSDASIGFYREILGFVTTDYDPEKDEIYDHLWSNNGILRASLGTIPESMPEARPNWLGFVRVKDVEAAVSRAVALGGTVYFKPDPEVEQGRVAVIEDPAGAAIVLMEYEPKTEDQP